jgi:hypothetical protein
MHCKTGLGLYPSYFFISHTDFSKLVLVICTLIKQNIMRIIIKVVVYYYIHNPRSKNTVIYASYHGESLFVITKDNTTYTFILCIIDPLQN